MIPLRDVDPYGRTIWCKDFAQAEREAERHGCTIEKIKNPEPRKGSP